MSSIVEQSSYCHSADYKIIESALKARWVPFTNLCQEMKDFVPRALSDYANEREAELNRMIEINPNGDHENILNWVNSQIDYFAKPEVQFSFRFGGRLEIEYVTVILLAHALCEAAINAILAIGLGKREIEDIFSVLDRVDICEKWRVAPKVLVPTYELKRGEALFDTLSHLTKVRNSFVHYKISLDIGGKNILQGRPIKKQSFKDDVMWLERFFSLPFDLLEHASRSLSDQGILFLLDRGQIQCPAAHRVKKK